MYGMFNFKSILNENNAYKRTHVWLPYISIIFNQNKIVGLFLNCFMSFKWRNIMCKNVLRVVCKKINIKKLCGLS